MKTVSKTSTYLLPQLQNSTLCCYRRGKQYCTGICWKKNKTKQKTTLNTDLFLLFFLFFFSFLCFLEFFLCFFFRFLDFSSEALSESDDESEDDSESLELSESLDEEDDLCLFLSSFLASSQNNKDIYLHIKQLEITSEK